jgi:hypothetical protein
MKEGIYQFEDSGSLVWAEKHQGKLIVVNGQWEIQEVNGKPHCKETNLNLKFIMDTPSRFEVMRYLLELGMKHDLKPLTRDYNAVVSTATRMMKIEDPLAE